jgi:hypothetical protein
MFEKQNANKTQWSWAKNCAIVVFYDASVAYFNWKTSMKYNSTRNTIKMHKFKGIQPN